MLRGHAWWERCYKAGGSSGHGSVGKYRDWKWGVIEKYVPKISSMDVIDVGCGDLTFWYGRNCAKYLGIDCSKSIIDKNRKSRVKWNFIVLPAEQHIPDIKATIVFCFDLLFHIEKPPNFRRILENLCQYSKDLIFVNNWIGSNLGDGRLCFHHPLEEHMDIFKRVGFRLLARHEGGPSPHGVIYVFRKERNP